MKALLTLFLATSLAFGATPTKEQVQKAKTLVASFVACQKDLAAQLETLKKANQTLTMTPDQWVGLTLNLMATSEGDLFYSFRQNMKSQMEPGLASKDVGRIELARLKIGGRILAQNDRYKWLLLLMKFQAKSPEMKGQIDKLSAVVTDSDDWLKGLALPDAKPIPLSPAEE